MILPRFSILWLLGLTAVCAVLSWIASYARRGDEWAIGLSAAIGSALLLFVAYIGAFFGAWIISQIESAFRNSDPPPVSPFQPGSKPVASPFAPIEPPVIADLGDASSPPPMTG